MGLLIYGYKERKEQEKQSQGKKTFQVDPTAPRRSAIRRAPSIPPHSSNTASERRNGRASPRSVRLSLQNYEVAERGGEVVFSRRPPASRFVAGGLTNSPPPPDQLSRRTHRAEMEDRQWHSIGGQAGSAQTMAEMAALDPLRQQLRRHRAAEDETDLRRLNRLHEVTVQAALRRVQEVTRLNRGNEGPSGGPSGPSGSSGISSGLDSYPPRDDPTLMSEVEEMRRSGLRSVNNPRIPPYFREMHRQIPAYDDLTIDARRELDSIMGTHLPPPPPPPHPRMDGLGDRIRSPSTNSSSDGGEDAWETLLTTMTPDARLPSLQSSFNTAAAENVAASMSGGSNNSSQRSDSSSRTRAETTATSPSLIDGPVDSVAENRRGARLQSPGCEEDGNGIATPDSLPELVRVERVRSPAASVRPDHVQGGDNGDEDGDEDGNDMERYSSERMERAWRQRQRRLNSNWADSPPSTASAGSDRLARSQGNRSFDEARRDLEREIEEFSRSRMQRLLADFMARGDSDGVPEELWQAFVPRNVLAGAASEDNNDHA